MILWCSWIFYFWWPNSDGNLMASCCWFMAKVWEMARNPSAFPVAHSTWNGAIGFPLCLTSLSRVHGAWSLHSKKDFMEMFFLFLQTPWRLLKVAESCCHWAVISTPLRASRPCLFNLTELEGQFLNSHWFRGAFRCFRGYRVVPWSTRMLGHIGLYHVISLS